MGIDWEGFELLPPELLERPSDISREEAWRRHRLRMQLLPGRLDALERLATANGVVVGQRGSRDCGAVEDWVHSTVLDRFPVNDLRPRLDAVRADMDALVDAALAAGISAGEALRDALGRDALRNPLDDPTEPVVSLIHDTGMLFGDERIARYPQLSWQLRRGSPRNLVYHHTVLMGFTKSPRYEAEPVFSYLLGLRGELQGDPHRRRWPAILDQTDQIA